MLYQMHTFCQIITITMANLIWDRGAVHMSSPVHQSNPASAGQRLRTHRSTRLQGHKVIWVGDKADTDRIRQDRTGQDTGYAMPCANEHPLLVKFSVASGTHGTVLCTAWILALLYFAFAFCLPLQLRVYMVQINGSGFWVYS
ncbi:hypothetical protein FPOAC2_11573 [Fusarium poae]|jgi:hypothetical protein